MNNAQISRAAYLATHRILAADLTTPLAGPGARRTHTIDVIAGIIKDEFEVHDPLLDEATDWWPLQPGEVITISEGSEEL